MRILKVSSIILLSAGLCRASLGQTPATQRRAELIRGRVMNDSGRALPGITVIATMAPDRSFRQAISDSAGRYEIRFDAGTGDYLVYAAHAGYRAFRRRVTLGQVPDITVDIQLRSEAAQLGAVRVTAAKPRPIPDMGQLRDPTAAAFNTQTVIAGVSPDLAGDLSALAATVPGMTVTPDGRLTAFGLPGQVQYSYNGTSLATTDIPRDARTDIRVLQSAFDPSIGGFGAALVNVQMAQGGRVEEMFGRLTLDAPPLQANDPTADRLGQRFTSAALNANWDGPITSHDAFYNTAVSVRRASRPAVSLFDATPDLLSLVGLAPDSVARLRAIAPRLGLSLSSPAASSVRYDERGSFIGRLDRYRDPGRYGMLWTNAFSLTAIGGFGRSGSPASSVVISPTLGSNSQTVNGQVIGTWLHQTASYSAGLTSSLGGSRSSVSPYLVAPTALVRVQSLNAGEVTDRSVTLGGTNAPGSARSTALWETTEETNFYVGSNHKMKLYGRLQIDDARNDPGGQQLGTFAYNSLSDLEANHPASFTRTFGSVGASETSMHGALSLGDLWQVTPNFQLQPGVRLEASRFRNAIEPNATLLSTLGISNTSVPNDAHASPRLGFAWQYRPTVAAGATGTNTTGRIVLPPRATLSGGIGEFRQTPTAAAVFPAITGTGLGLAGAHVTCIGSASPTPDWQTLIQDPATSPRACASGSPTQFVDAEPSVTRFDPDYTFARSWRANLRFGSAIHRVRYSLDGWLSYNLNQPGTRDLNFRDSTRFTLADEGNRPVFVDPTSIVPGTGLIAPLDSRRSASFDRVTDLVSDLHSVARQLTVLVAPELDRAVLGISYTLSDITTYTRGFDDATFGTPTTISRSRSPYAPRHQFIVNAGYQFGATIGISANWRISSGMPYTPVVGSDVNGDGLLNDRAYVFAPSGQTDAQLATQLRALLATAPSQARDCLLRQLGTAAAKNGCEGPWTSTMNAAISTGFLHVLDGRYLIASIYMTNPLGGLDQLLHGSDNLRGWGTTTAPDPVLYTVQGFDASRREFRYAVNPRFGNTRLSGSTVREPFRITLDVRVELGHPVRRQSFERFLQMNALRGDRALAPVDSLRARLLDYKVSDVYDVMLRMRDSLLLSRDQVDSLERLRAAYEPHANAVWREVSAYIHARAVSGNYDVNDISRRVDATTAQGWAVAREELPKVRALMTPAQLALVDVILKPFADSDKRIPPRPYLF